MMSGSLWPASEEAAVIEHKGTEPPWTGKFVKHHAKGTYHCKRCDRPLFASDTKFDSRSGWPSFDDALAGVERGEDRT